MREMVFRERTEKVAHVRAFAEIIARTLGSDASRFNGVIADYASEVFQESYDSTILAQKQAALKEAQRRIQARRNADLHALQKLQRMEKLGEAFEARTEAKRGKAK